MLLKEERLEQPVPIRASLAAARIVVCLLGLVCNVIVASVTNSVGGGAEDTFRRFVIVYVPLVLALAAPVCCLLAFVHRWGDRWIVGYVAAWAAIIATGFASVWISRL